MKCKVIHFLLYIQNFIIDFIRNILFTSYDHPVECSKILILRTGSLGDGVCAMPASVSYTHLTLPTIYSV